MSSSKSTKLNIRDDRPTALASSVHGSNIDAIGFNLVFLASKDPKLAIEVLKLYDLARQVKESDPPAHEEDYGLFTNELHKLYPDLSDYPK